MSNKDNRADFSVVLSQTDGGQVAYTQPKFASVEELAFFLEASARAGTAVIVGSPGRVPPAATASALAYIDFSVFNKTLEHDSADQVINVETGITIGALQKHLAAHQQWWPISVSPDSLLIDVLNSGYGGHLEHRYGAIRELVLGMTVILADGRSIKCGGKVVKNVTGYDLAKLFIGSGGTLGLPRTAYLRLFALPEHSATWLLACDEVSEIFEAVQSLRLSALPISALEVIQGELTRRLLPNVVPDKRLVLAVQAHGLREVVAEIASVIQQNYSRSGQAVCSGKKKKSKAEKSEPASPWIEISGKGEEKFWSAMSNLGDPAVELALTQTQISHLVQGLLSTPQPPAFQATPSRGRIRVFASTSDVDDSAHKAIIDWVNHFYLSGDSSVTMAHATDEFNLSVRRVPYEDLVSKKLKKDLKAKFDPSAVLNPFVAL